MQATGRMAGQAGPTVFQAVATLVVAATLVVGLTLAAQRIQTGGSAVAAPAPDAAAVQQALNDHRLGEKAALLKAGTWTSGDVDQALRSRGVAPFDPSDFRLSEKQPLTTTPSNVVQIIPGEYRPIAAPEKPDAIRRGTIAHR
jgi:hypothetical protein